MISPVLVRSCQGFHIRKGRRRAGRANGRRAPGGAEPMGGAGRGEAARGLRGPEVGERPYVELGPPRRRAPGLPPAGPRPPPAAPHGPPSPPARPLSPRAPLPSLSGCPPVPP